MKVVVCVKHIPDGPLRLDPSSKRLDRHGDGELNKVDLNAIEEALRLKDASDVEVVAISMGPEKAVESLRTALGLGVDRAVLICDPSVVGPDLVVTAKVLAKALAREAADLVLFGQQASDSSGGALWAAVAELLACPVVSQATGVTINSEMAQVTRQTEFGDDVIEALLPLVVSVTDAINEPRYASLRGMMGAKRKPLETLSLSDLGMETSEVSETASRTAVRSIADPPLRGGAQKIRDEGKAAEAIVAFLEERQLL